ncbi:MAG: alpha/beta hydrolase, partial [Tepidisphaeraceae bacterium]
LGLGASMGAAALISAASDDSPEGQAISAVAVYDTFDDLPSLAHSVAVSRFVPPLSWVADRFGLALASFQTGADLENFRPSRCIAQLWPRPVMVIHAQDDLIIPFQHGQALFDAASEPKRQLWVGGGHNQVLNDESVAREVRDFFDEARAVPAI